MKRKFFRIAAMLLLSLLMVLPASAAEYGVIYDETELLWSEELETLGTLTLPEFTQTHQLDVRVDVLTGIGNYENIADTAVGLYENYDYGSETDGKALTLTIWVYEDETGVGLNDWYIYCTDDTLEASFAEAVVYLTKNAWDGDYEQDSQALVNTINGMLESVEPAGTDATKENVVVDLMGQEVVTDSEETYADLTGIVEENWKDKEAQLDHVTDSAGLLTESQWQTLESKARDIQEAYGFGVYVVTVDDYYNYSHGSVMDAATSIYQQYSLGTGAEKDGLMLLLSMNDRDYSLITHGSFGNYAFNNEGRAKMTSFFLDDFANNDWYAGFSDYLEWSADYLEEAKKGEPYSYEKVAMSAKERSNAILTRVAIILVVPLVVAAIYIGILSSKMKNVAEATRAGAYVSGNLNLTKKVDKFAFATQSKVKIQTQKSSGGGGTRSGSSGGFSGTSGKF